MCVYVNHSVVSDSLWPRGLQPTRLLCPWDSPGKNTGVGYHFPLQGIFPTQGSNPGLPRCKQIPYHLSHQGNPWKVFLGGNKIIQVENSNLHKERKNITEEIGKGKIKFSFLFFLIDLIDNNLFKVTISTTYLIMYNYGTSVKEHSCQCR